MCEVQEADESVAQGFESRYEAKVSVAKHKIHAIQEKHRLAAQIEVEALQKTRKRPFGAEMRNAGLSKQQILKSRSLRMMMRFMGKPDSL